MRSFQVDLPANRNPWEIPFSVRMAEFLEEFHGNVVMMVADAPNTSSFRYRVYNIKQWLGGSGIRISYFYRDELKQIEPFLKRCNLVVFCRAQWTLGIQKTIDLLKIYGIPIAFDVDDIICCLDRIQLVTNTLNVDLDNEQAYSFWSAMLARGELVAKQCDAFVSTNRFLAETLSSSFSGKPSYVIENSLNREQLEISQRVLARKSQAWGDEDFLIGYFSGTPSHINDFKAVAPEILQVLKDYPQSKLVVVGFMEFPADMQPFIKEGRIVFKPLVDFMELQAEMAAVDVSIVPLVDNEFTNCKSELKYFEGAIVGTLTLATPIYTYAHSIRDGETGFLCRNGQWYQRLSEIIEGRHDVRAMVGRARMECLSRYSGDGFAASCEKTYSALVQD